MQRLQFRILGPVEIRADGRPLALGTPKQRALLAALLAATNAFVPVDQLVEELWCGLPPSSAIPNLRNYLANIRHVLPADERFRVETRPSSYRIQVRDEELDYAVFEQCARAGHTAMVREDMVDAAIHLQRALGLWRGLPLEDVVHGSRLSKFAGWLNERYIGVTEDLFEVRLCSNGLGELVLQLRNWVAEHPFRERPWRLLMIALHKQEDPRSALAAYAELRKLLQDELGIEPSPELKELHQALLQRSVGDRAGELAHRLS